MRLLALLSLVFIANWANAGVTVDRKLVQTLKISKTRALVTDACFSPDGKTLYVAWDKENSDGGGLTAWDVKTGKLKRIFMQRPILRLGISPDGKTLVCDDNLLRPRNALSRSPSQQRLRVWDAATGRLKHTLATPCIEGFAFSPDGKMLATGVYDGPKSGIGWRGCIIVRDLESWQVRRIFRSKLKYTPNEIAFSSDGQLLFASASQSDTENGGLQIWNYRTGQTLRYFENVSDYAERFLLPNTHTLIFGGKKMDLRYKNSRFRPVFKKRSGDLEFMGVWPHHENLWVYIYFDERSFKDQLEPHNLRYPYLEWWDTNTRQRVARWKNDPPFAKGMTFSRDGQYFAEWCDAPDNSDSQEKYANVIKIYRLTLNSHARK
jgi:WD40 repeat protein